MSNDLNKVFLIGRLTRDAELKYTKGGTPVSSFSLAVNRRRKSGDTWTDEANFFDFSYFGKGAESLNQYLTKGKQIGVEGELHQNRWEQDGQPRSKVEIVAGNIQLLGGGQSNGNSGSSRGSAEQDYQSDLEDENIPF